MNLIFAFILNENENGLFYIIKGLVLLNIILPKLMDHNLLIYISLLGMYKFIWTKIKFNIHIYYSK